MPATLYRGSRRYIVCAVAFARRVFVCTDRPKNKKPLKIIGAMKNSTIHKGDPLMMSNRLRVVIAAMTVVLLLTPALIWSDKHTSRTVINNVSLKLPPASTIGPEQQSYSPTQLEQEKRLRHESFSSPSHHTRGMPRLDVTPKNAAYPGMTSAELEKLTRMRETPSNTQTPSSRQASDPTSTIEDVPRAPGIEGLTARERAKLEDHLRKQN